MGRETESNRRSGGKGEPVRLLYAEDEKSLARAVSTILTRNNYAVDTVSDGESALEWLETGNYDGVILDVMMPRKPATPPPEPSTT